MAARAERLKRLAEPKLAAALQLPARGATAGVSTSTQPPDGACSRCSAPTEAEQLFCGSCGTVQHAPSTLGSHFRLLDMHPKFDINLHQLDDRFKRLQFQVHPDRFSTASEEEQAAAASQAARLNTAYKVLRDPQSRGEHLLQLNGLDTHELSESGTISDMDFLTEIMELQEKIDTALAQEDTKTLQSERSRAERAVEERTRQLSSAFATGNLTAAKDLLVKLSYYQRALSRC